MFKVGYKTNKTTKMGFLAKIGNGKKNRQPFAKKLHHSHSDFCNVNLNTFNRSAYSFYVNPEHVRVSLMGLLNMDEEHLSQNNCFQQVASVSLIDLFT